MQLVSKHKKHAKLIAKSRPKLVTKKKKIVAKKRSLLTGKSRGAKKSGGPRERSGRFSIFRPKVRGRAYPVQDNIGGWKLFDKMVKSSGLSGSDLHNLGLRLLAREFPKLTKESGIAMGRRLDDALDLAS